MAIVNLNKVTEITGRAKELNHSELIELQRDIANLLEVKHLNGIRDALQEVMKDKSIKRKSI
jgi:cytochrome b involved in lipid metabolism